MGNFISVTRSIDNHFGNGEYLSTNYHYFTACGRVVLWYNWLCIYVPHTERWQRLSFERLEDCPQYQALFTDYGANFPALRLAVMKLIEDKVFI